MWCADAVWGARFYCPPHRGGQPRREAPGGGSGRPKCSSYLKASPKHGSCSTPRASFARAVPLFKGDIPSPHVLLFWTGLLCKGDIPSPHALPFWTGLLTEGDSLGAKRQAGGQAGRNVSSRAQACRNMARARPPARAALALSPSVRGTVPRATISGSSTAVPLTDLLHPRVRAAR